MNLEELMAQTLDKMTWEALTGQAYTNVASDDSNSLTIDKVRQAYDLLKSIKPTKLYYVLSEYVENKDAYYKVFIPYEKIEVWFMHPDAFPRFEFEARYAGYKFLIDYARHYLPAERS